MHVATDVFLGAVLDGLVRGEMLRGTEVEAAFVGVQAALASDVIGHDLADAHLVGHGDMERANAAAPKPTDR